MSHFSVCIFACLCVCVCLGFYVLILCTEIEQVDVGYWSLSLALFVCVRACVCVCSCLKAVQAPSFSKSAGLKIQSAWRDSRLYIICHGWTLSALYQ